MNQYAIMETDEGFAIMDVSAGDDPVAVAEEHGGQLVDAGPYKSYDDALDALMDLEGAEEDLE